MLVTGNSVVFTVRASSLVSAIGGCLVSGDSTVHTFKVKLKPPHVYSIQVGKKEKEIPEMIRLYVRGRRSTRRVRTYRGKIFCYYKKHSRWSADQWGGFATGRECRRQSGKLIACRTGVIFWRLAGKRESVQPCSSGSKREDSGNEVGKRPNHRA